MPSRTVHDGGEPMDEERRQERVLEALECLAADVERLRLLREHELGVRVVSDEEGNLLIRPAGEG